MLKYETGCNGQNVANFNGHVEYKLILSIILD